MKDRNIIGQVGKTQYTNFFCLYGGCWGTSLAFDNNIFNQFFKCVFKVPNKSMETQIVTLDWKFITVFSMTQSSSFS